MKKRPMNRLREPHPAGLVLMKVIRRVRAFNPLRVSGTENLLLSQETAAATSALPPVRISQNYPLLKSPVSVSQSRTQETVVAPTEEERDVEGPVCWRNSSTPVRDRGIYFPHLPSVPQSQNKAPQSYHPDIPQRRNVLGKPTVQYFARVDGKLPEGSRNNSKSISTSEHSSTVQIAAGELQSLVKPACFVLGQTITAERHKEEPPYLLTAHASVDDDSDSCAPSLPIHCDRLGLEIILTPPLDDPAFLQSAPSTPVPSRPVPPTTGISFCTKASGSVQLKVRRNWQDAYAKEKLLVVDLRRKLATASGNVAQDRKRADKLEHELLLTRAEAARAQEYVEHYKKLYESQKTELSLLRQQLRKEFSDSARYGRITRSQLPYIGERSELSPCEVLAQESLGIGGEVEAPRYGIPKQIENMDAFAISPQALGPLEAAAKLPDDGQTSETRFGEAPARATRHNCHELSATSSHEVLRPNRPASLFEEDNHVKAESEDIPYELSELAALRSSFSDLFEGSKRRTHDAYEEEESI